MDPSKKLRDQKKQILSNISKAASEGKTNKVLEESEKLERIENLIMRQDQIILELEQLRNGNSPIAPRNTRRIVTRPVSELRSRQMISSRELGGQIRNEFLKKLGAENIHLQLNDFFLIFQV